MTAANTLRAVSSFGLRKKPQPTSDKPKASSRVTPMSVPTISRSSIKPKPHPSPLEIERPSVAAIPPQLAASRARDEVRDVGCDPFGALPVRAVTRFLVDLKPRHG